MKRFIKIVLALLGILIVLVIVAVVVAVLVIDPNQYKGQISTAVRNATGRELTIQGDLHLSVFPWLGVETGAMSLSNRPGFGAEPFASIDAAAVHVRLLPLLRRDVEVDTVTLDGLNLHLIRNAQGVTNWGDLTAQNPEQAPAARTPGGEGESGSPISAVAIGGVRVRKATVDWDDRQNKVHYRLYNLNVHTGSVALNKPVKVEVESDVESSAPALTAHIALDTEARYDAAAQHAQLNNLKLTLNAKPKDLPAQDANLTVTGNADLDLGAQRYRIEALHADARLQGPKLPGKRIEATLDAQVAADMNKQTLDVTKLKLGSMSMVASGNVHGSDLLTTPRFTGTLTVPAFNARQLLGQLDPRPLETADPKALTNVAADLAFTASKTAAELTKLQAQVDQTHLNGTASIRDFAHPAYRFQLTVDQLDADRYLPPAAEEKAPPATPATVGAAAMQLPMDTLRALDLDGNVSVGKLKVANLTVSDIKAGITGKSGLIHASPLSAKLYGGSYSGDTLLDARGKTPQIAVNERLEGVDIGALSRDFLKKDLIAGKGSLNMKLHGTGADPQALLRTLDGNLGFNLKDGRLNGFNLAALLKQDYVKYLQQLSVDPGDLNQTVFSKFAGTANVRDGVLETKDLTLSSAQLDVKGRGTVNLPTQQLDLVLEAQPVGQFGKQLQQYSTTAVPIKVEGTITAPRFSVKFDQVLKDKAKQRLNQEKQKLQQQLKDKSKQQQDKVEQQLKDKLKGLFK